MSRVHTPVTNQLAAYIRSVTLREPEPLKRLREETEDHSHASMQTSPEQGQFLQLLARLTGARKALEIGVFMGYSSTWVALALPPGGKVVACDVSPEYTARARRTWQEAGVEDRIELNLAPALETLDRLIAEGQAGTFDFAFIDADKAGYCDYYDRTIALLRPGGVLAADNVLWHGLVADTNDHDPETEAIRAFNRKLHADARVTLGIVPLGDGLTVLCKL
ncbi:MAG: O-methyltransferase [Bryobacteraceae bacterium]